MKVAIPDQGGHLGGKVTKRAIRRSPPPAMVWSGHAGAVLLAELADRLGLPGELVATPG